MRFTCWRVLRIEFMWCPPHPSPHAAPHSIRPYDKSAVFIGYTAWQFLARTLSQSTINTMSVYSFLFKFQKFGEVSTFLWCHTYTCTHAYMHTHAEFVLLNLVQAYIYAHIRALECVLCIITHVINVRECVRACARACVHACVCMPNKCD